MTVRIPRSILPLALVNAQLKMPLHVIYMSWLLRRGLSKLVANSTYVHVPYRAARTGRARPIIAPSALTMAGCRHAIVW
jgi:hypothetical protein